jgi:hypothetical protein
MMTNQLFVLVGSFIPTTYLFLSAFVSPPRRQRSNTESMTCATIASPSSQIAFRSDQGKPITECGHRDYHPTKPTLSNDISIVAFYLKSTGSAQAGHNKEVMIHIIWCFHRTTPEAKLVLHTQHSSKFRCQRRWHCRCSRW